MDDSIKSLIDQGNLTWDKLILGLKPDNGTLEDCSVNIEKIDNDIEKLKKTAACIEYLDTYEFEGIILKATKPSETNPTHNEIHPSFILGIMANQTIFPENNPYPRNAFSCGQAKQGVSMYHTNFNNRIDKTAYVLNYGQTPIVKSRYLDYVSKERHPYGENAIVAVACYSGFNVEDAIIVNRAALERGLFRTTYYNMYDAHEEKENIGGAKINTTFMSIMNNNVIGLKPGYDYSNLDPETGLIKENTRVKDKVVVIGKTTNSLVQSGLYVDMSKATKKGQIGYVDKSFITNNVEGERLAKIRIREERIPEMGDKFCSRAGQKGTIGIVLDECDMPFTKDGLRPDIIVNPHAMPSRMTIGHLVETLIGKACILKGGFGDCTAFLSKGPKDKIFGNMLTSEGFHSSGNEYLYNGMTGEQLETEIYFGPTYYLRLKHMPKDKINYRARGPRSNLTRQTVGGRANDGGLRIGEMDRDSLIAHGMSHFINESMLVRGDQYYMAICNHSGCIAIYNESKNIFLSPQVDGPLKFVGDMEKTVNIVPISKFGRDFSIVRVPYAFKLLLQELKTMNIQMRIITEDNVDQLMSLVQDDSINKMTEFNSYTELGIEMKELIKKEKRKKDVLEATMEVKKIQQPQWNLTTNVMSNILPTNMDVYKVEDFNKGQVVYLKADEKVGTKWTIIQIEDNDIVLNSNGEINMVTVDEISPTPPFKSMKQVKEPTLEPYKEDSPSRDAIPEDKRVPITVSNVRVDDIIYFYDDKRDQPKQWLVKDILEDTNQIRIVEQVEWWDDSTPERGLTDIKGLYKGDEGIISPTYGPDSPTYGPDSPNTSDFVREHGFKSYNPVVNESPQSLNTPTDSPAYSDWIRPQELNELSVDEEEGLNYERGEAPQIRTNLVRIYTKDGEYTGKDGKKYNLKPKSKTIGDDLTILGNFDDSDDEKDDDKKDDKNIKKSIKLIN
jgi:hypothetical protein